MEFHTKCLLRLCRVCQSILPNIAKRNIVPSKISQPANSHKEKILYAFGISIEEDEGEVHPPQICQKCIRKCNHANKDPQRHKKYLADDKATWTKHSQTSICKTCHIMQSSNQGGIRKKPCPPHLASPLPYSLTHDDIFTHIHNNLAEFLKSRKLEDLSSNADVQKLFKCGICGQIVLNPVYTNCQHGFCATCMTTTFQEKRSRTISCPTCADPIMYNQISKIPHALQVHYTNLDLKCPHCLQVYPLHGNYKHVCPKSPMKSPTPVALMTQLAHQHTPERPLPDTVVEPVCTAWVGLMLPKKRMIELESKPTAKKRSTNMGKHLHGFLLPYRCKHCLRSFGNFGRWTKHRRSHLKSKDLYRRIRKQQSVFENVICRYRRTLHQLLQRSELQDYPMELQDYQGKSQGYEAKSLGYESKSKGHEAESHDREAKSKGHEVEFKGHEAHTRRNKCVPCPECGILFGNGGALATHKRYRHGIGLGLSGIQYQNLDLLMSRIVDNGKIIRYQESNKLICNATPDSANSQVTLPKTQMTGVITGQDQGQTNIMGHKSRGKGENESAVKIQGLTGLKGHCSMTALEEEVKVQKSQLKPFKCSLCRRFFSNFARIKSHKKLHMKQYYRQKHLRKLKKFEVSDKFAPFYKSFSERKRSHVHKIDFICEICGKKFEHEQDTIKHKKAHQAVNAKQVVTSGAAVNDQTDHHLSNDLEKTQTDTDYDQSVVVVPYLCFLCGKEFSKKSTLTSHEKLHDYETPQNKTANPSLIISESGNHAHDTRNCIESGLGQNLMCDKVFAEESAKVPEEKLREHETPSNKIAKPSVIESEVGPNPVDSSLQGSPGSGQLISRRSPSVTIGKGGVPSTFGTFAIRGTGLVLLQGQMSAYKTINGLFQCVHCTNMTKKKTIFESSNKAFKHVAERHNKLHKQRYNKYKNKYHYQCKYMYCTQTFPDRPSMWIHKYTHPEYKTTMDVIQVASYHAYGESAKDKSTISGSFLCRHCSKRFISSVQVADHVAEYHDRYTISTTNSYVNNTEVYQCRFCDLRFVGKEELGTHKQSHEGYIPSMEYIDGTKLGYFKLTPRKNDKFFDLHKIDVS